MPHPIHPRNKPGRLTFTILTLFLGVRIPILQMGKPRREVFTHSRACSSYVVKPSLESRSRRLWSLRSDITMLHYLATVVFGNVCWIDHQWPNSSGLVMLAGPRTFQGVILEKVAFGVKTHDLTALGFPSVGCVCVKSTEAWTQKDNKESLWRSPGQ